MVFIILEDINTITIFPTNLVGNSEFLFSFVGQKTNMYSRTSLINRVSSPNTLDIKIVFDVVHTQGIIAYSIIDVF